MKAEPSPERFPGPAQPIAWDRGHGEIWPLGAALHRLVLKLDDGREVTPLAEAPWQGEAETTADASIPAHLRHLGGEWACVPFGRSGVDPVVHGYGTDNMWRLTRADAHAGEWQIDYPADHPIERLTRTVAGVPGKAAVAFTLSVLPRRDCVLPVGLHPILTLPQPGEDIRIEAEFAHGETFPVVFERGVSLLAPARRFISLDALPLAAGGAGNVAGLSHRATEEAFQIFGVSGSLRVVYPRQRYAVLLEWSAADFPTCLFWMSAGGRRQKPWNGRFRGLGVEPLAASFAERAGEGAITGGRAFRAGEIWTSIHSLSVAPLEEDR